MPVKVLKTRPEYVGRREMSYGGKIAETVHVYNYNGKLFMSEGVIGPLSYMKQAAKASEIIFPAPKSAQKYKETMYDIARPFKGKIKSTRKL